MTRCCVCAVATKSQMRQQMLEMANAVLVIKGELMAVLEHLWTMMQPSQ